MRTDENGNNISSADYWKSRAVEAEECLRKERDVHRTEGEKARRTINSLKRSKRALEKELSEIFATVRRVVREEVAHVNIGLTTSTTIANTRTQRSASEPPLLLLTVEEAADRLRVSQNAIRQWLTTKRIPSYKVGRLVRIRREDLDAFVEPTREE